MANVEAHAPGSFCWIELGTTDQNAAKKFYSELFGWTSEDMPMGPSEFYTIFKLNGREAAAGYTLNAEMRARHVPPHWMLYVAAANADETTEKAARAGAKIVATPFDVMDAGRMSVLEDPTGAFFSVWQAKNSPGIRISGAPGALCWADLMTPDPARASQFYQTVFGWQISPGEHGGGYLHIKNGEHFIGGIPPAEFRNPNAPPHWLAYFMVKDCDASTAKATQDGAKVYVNPMSMEGVGRWSVIADPQGAVSALFQSPEHHG